MNELDDRNLIVDSTQFFLRGIVYRFSITQTVLHLHLWESFLMKIAISLLSFLIFTAQGSHSVYRTSLTLQ